MSKSVKYIAILGLLCLAFSVYFNASLYFENRRLEKFKQNSIEERKRISDSIVKSNLIIVDSLITSNQFKTDSIADNKAIIDSLKEVKSKVKTVYKVKYKEIEGFDANKLEEYWQNELK